MALGLKSGLSRFCPLPLPPSCPGLGAGRPLCKTLRSDLSVGHGKELRLGAGDVRCRKLVATWILKLAFLLSTLSDPT